MLPKSASESRQYFLFKIVDASVRYHLRSNSRENVFQFSNIPGIVLRRIALLQLEIHRISPFGLEILGEWTLMSQVLGHNPPVECLPAAIDAFVRYHLS